MDNDTALLAMCVAFLGSVGIAGWLIELWHKRRNRRRRHLPINPMSSSIAPTHEDQL